MQFDLGMPQTSESKIDILVPLKFFKIFCSQQTFYLFIYSGSTIETLENFSSVPIVDL